MKQEEEAPGILSVALLYALGEDRLMARDEATGFWLLTDYGRTVLAAFVQQILNQRIVARSA